METLTSKIAKAPYLSNSELVLTLPALSQEVANWKHLTYEEQDKLYDWETGCTPPYHFAIMIGETTLTYGELLTVFSNKNFNRSLLAYHWYQSLFCRNRTGDSEDCFKLFNAASETFLSADVTRSAMLKAHTPNFPTTRVVARAIFNSSEPLSKKDYDSLKAFNYDMLEHALRGAPNDKAFKRSMYSYHSWVANDERTPINKACYAYLKQYHDIDAEGLPDDYVEALLDSIPFSEEKFAQMISCKIDDDGSLVLLTF